MNQWMARKLKYVTRNLAAKPAAGIVRMLTARLQGCKTKAEVRAKKIELLSELASQAKGSGISLTELRKYMKLIAYLVDIWALISLAIKLRPPFICRCLVPTHLRLPASRIEVLQPLVGRAPPLDEVFVPIPKLEQQGSCARSDLPADSAY